MEAPYDEIFDGPGRPRDHYRTVMDALGETDLVALEARMRAGVVERRARYGATGSDAFVVDAVPRLLPAEEWDLLERGLTQRVRALDAFLADAYGERRIVDAGVIEDRVIEEGGFVEPDLRGMTLPLWVGFAGLDVVRGADGGFRVLEDNTRMPTGIGFSALAWELVSEHLGDVVPAPVRALEAFADILRRAAPEGVRDRDPQLAVLGDGFDNDAQWEISEVAYRMGVPMVGLDDLETREGRLFMRIEGRRRPVDVLYRRSNSHLLRDPDGSPTVLSDRLLEPMRRGTVTVVNPPGVGVADDKLTHVHVEAMIGFYLGEAPVLPSAKSWDLAVSAHREEALDRLSELVVKVRDRVGGEGVLIGPEAAAARADIESDPADYIAQERLLLSQHLTLIDGELVPRHVDLRPLIAYDGSEATLLGALSRVALTAGDGVVNMSAGGGCKATWGLLPQ